MIPLRDLNPTRGPTLVTWIVIAACIVVFFALQPRSGSESAEFLYERAAVPCEIVSGDALTIDEITSGSCDDEPGPQFAAGKSVYASVLTSMFLHGSLLHLLGNIWILWIFGNNIEDDLGSVRFAIFYLVAGLAAAAGHLAVYSSSTIPVVGASGAIAGVMGAYLVLHPLARVVSIVPPLFFLPFRVPAFVYLVVWFVLQFALSGRDSNVAWEAHVVGFGFGVAIAAMLRSTVLVRRRRTA